MLCCTVSLAPCCIPKFSSSLFCTMLSAVVTTTDMKSAVTSYDVMHSPGSSVMFLIFSVKSCVFYMWCCACLAMVEEY